MDEVAVEDEVVAVGKVAAAAIMVGTPLSLVIEADDVRVAVVEDEVAADEDAEEVITMLGKMAIPRPLVATGATKVVVTVPEITSQISQLKNEGVSSSIKITSSALSSIVRFSI